MNSSSLRLVAPGTGCGFRLKAGAMLRIVDVSGQQSGDLMGFCASDHAEVLCNGRSFDYWNRIYARRGDALYSNRSRAMFTILEAEGRHDFLYGACSKEMYELQYGIRDHRNCYDNLTQALREIVWMPPSCRLRSMSS